MLWLRQQDVGFQALLERQQPSTTATLHRADTEVRIPQISVSAFTGEPMDTARCRPVSRLNTLFLFISPISMSWDSFAAQRKRLGRDRELAKFNGKWLVGLEILLSCMWSPLQTGEQKGRKAGLFLNLLLDFCFCLKLLCVVRKKKKKRSEAI